MGTEPSKQERTSAPPVIVILLLSSVGQISKKNRLLWLLFLVTLVTKWLLCWLPNFYGSEFFMVPPLPRAVTFSRFFRKKYKQK